MAKPIKINSGQVRFQDATGIVFIPWEDGEVGENGYDIHDIVGDTVSLTQDEADRTEIPWEFGDDPLDENVTLGTRNLTMQCLDFQNAIMENIFGWEKDENGDFVWSPAQYKDMWCTIILKFVGKSIVMPKVKMDARATIENLRSDIARGDLSGILYSTAIKFGAATALKESGMFFMKDGKNFVVGATEDDKGAISGGVMVSVDQNGEITIEKVTA